MNENVGLIGYGIMGKAIADKLIAKGYSVLVHDKSPEANSNARASGCAVMNAPKEIAMKAKVVLLSLPHPKNVVSVVRNGPDWQEQDIPHGRTKPGSSAKPANRS